MLTETQLDRALQGSRPPVAGQDDTTTASISRMVSEVTSAQRGTRSASRVRSIVRRPIFLIPAIGVLALATTAGAVAYSFSKSDAAVIPINYRTASGQQISCGYGVSAVVENGAASTARLRDYVRSHDWSGVGQEVYRYALAHPYVPSASEVGQFTPSQIDSFSFSTALAAVIGRHIPASVEPQGYLGGGESDCLGVLR